MAGRPALDGADTTQLFVSSMRPDRRPTPRASGVRVATRPSSSLLARSRCCPKTGSPRSDRSGRRSGQRPRALPSRRPWPRPRRPRPRPRALPGARIDRARAHRARIHDDHAADRPAASGGGAGSRRARDARPRLHGVAQRPGGRRRPRRRGRGRRRDRRAPRRPHRPNGGGRAPAAAPPSTCARPPRRRWRARTRSCLADLDEADRLDPAGAVPTLESVRAFCEMVAGSASRVAGAIATISSRPTRPSKPPASRLPRTPWRRSIALATSSPRVPAPSRSRTILNAAWQKGDTNQCITVGNDLVTSLEALPDRTGGQQAVRMQTAAALSTAAQCAAKGGRCDEARAFYRTRMRVVTKQPTSPATDAEFRVAYPECAAK